MASEHLHNSKQNAPAFTRRIFSGIQPSGHLTLGNYLGALKRFVALQQQGIESIYCVVDLHAITVWQDPHALRQNTRELTAAFIACGLEPQKSVLFNQSQVPAHAQLGWVFNTVVRLGWMSRMTQFKDKAGKNSENVSLGLFAYPALMAADILLYKATDVPVGEDQKQHVELTRDIAEKFNHDYGRAVFPSPNPMIEGAGMRVMSLRDGTKKMSKSDASDLSRINLSDDADTIAKKIRKAKTDAECLPQGLDALAGRAEARNLINIFAALSDVAPQAVLDEFAGKEFSQFKPALADLAVEKLSPITKKINALMDAPEQIDAVLSDGAQRASAIAEPVLDEVFETIGLVR